eukprot:CAMPEP_0202865680 /NCGR_PEP_ID=MMETSP1391-20130828/6292_1 /ASSEMBLY_ACC=CAM_ASM_000867 /TAXON_ID=1034604 /ORGANISM="Chlamydomonas leiostraca, Strain SAG 11-49" /LENGTH=356 /DNA_ID=CAMNT_0049545545 /DNA_START=139 /DNA_END=1210 /DNA_ORIENTATION=+
MWMGSRFPVKDCQELWTNLVVQVKAVAAENVDDVTGEDFYSLLGLDVDASAADIKSAYRSLMRALHPDMAHAQAGGSEEALSQANALAALLNEIYETLSDPEKRATYDALAGFGGDESTVNPLMDTRAERDQVFVDEITCIGCGKCVRQCPATFEIEASKYGRARVISQTADIPDDIQIAIEVCPVSCIYWVSLPQLSLLEAALAVLPRVEVFILQRSGNRAAGNVFNEAFKAFERRRAAHIAAKARAAGATAAAAASAVSRSSGITVDLNFWMNREAAAGARDATTASSGTGQDSGGSSQGDGDTRRIAGLAAAAARAARLWRQYGGSISRRPKASLAEHSSASSISMDDGAATV